MKYRVAILVCLIAATSLAHAKEEKPLRLFIQAGTQAPIGARHPEGRFLEEWSKLLKDRGAEVDGGSIFPAREELSQTDVLLLYSADAGAIAGENRKSLEAFLKRGGGLIVLHDPMCGSNADWLKRLAGDASELGPARSREGLMGLYFQDSPHPITEGVANFDLDEEMFLGLKLMPDAKLLATAFSSGGELAPQMWAYEKRKHRSFVWLQGSQEEFFRLPHARGLLLRAIAWTGQRQVDLLTSMEERASFSYPQGGPTHPLLAARKIKTQREFDLQLAAAEPTVVNPISLDWDARGRMWVAIAPTHALRLDRSPTQDCILILEDPDGDGIMDKRGVFYEGLNQVTSLVLHQDGAIVTQAPEILRLRDIDGDGVADKREVLFSGFGRGDSRSAISHLRWGLDGWIYGCQGSGGNDSGRITGAGGKVFGKIGPGIFRFKPDGTAIEMVSSCEGNPGGIDFSWDGELFFSKSKGSHISHVVMPERFLARGKIGKVTSDKSVEDHQSISPIFRDPRPEYSPAGPGNVFSGASGCMIYDGGAWPEKYHGGYFVCDPSRHLVHEDVIISLQEGLSFEATRRQDEEFLAGADLWFSPVELRSGPDGAVYLLDFYDQALSAGAGPGLVSGTGSAALRPDYDRTHGRIWRIQHQRARHPAMPGLASATSLDLANALEHPNGWVRRTAQRLLVESGDKSAAPKLAALLKSRLPYARIHALWCLYHLGGLTEDQLAGGIKDTHPSVQKNALQILGERGTPLTSTVAKAIDKQFAEMPDRVRLCVLLALSGTPFHPDDIKNVLKIFPDAKDAWSRSAFLGLARQMPLEFIKAAFASDKHDAYKELVATLAEDMASGQQAEAASSLVQTISTKRPATNQLKLVVIESMAKAPGPEFVPRWSSELKGAFEELLSSDSYSLRIAAFALVSQWDATGVLAAKTSHLQKEMIADLGNEKLGDEKRTNLVTSLMSVSSIRGEVIVALDKLQDTKLPDGLRRHLLNELGKSGERAAAEVLIRRFSGLNLEMRQAVLEALLRRPVWRSMLVEALAKKEISLPDLGVDGVSRLQQHPARPLAERVAGMIAAQRGTPSKDKRALVARFLPLLQKPADTKNGKELFKRNCAICHKLGGEGKDLGPDLTGVGLQGSMGLLTHILDPNRTVEGRFVPYNASTKKGQDYFGLLTQESKETILLRNSAGDVELRRADLAFLKPTGLSFMPEGSEALGEQSIGDIVGYLAEKTPKGFRPLDLSGAFTADSRKGLYAEQSDSPSLELKRYGIVMVENIPFRVVNPATSSNGKNIIVLKGGIGFAETLPRHVEFAVGARAKKIHILGGVAGWGFASTSPDPESLPAAKAKLFYADGAMEEILFKNGDEFADFSAQIDVPGSKYAPDLVAKGQLRWFTVVPGRSAEITKIVLESYDNRLAPTFVALTAQVPE